MGRIARITQAFALLMGPEPVNRCTGAAQGQHQPVQGLQLAGVRGLRPEETQYSGAAENLPNLWVAVRSAVREVVDEVSLAELISGRMPAHVRKLTTRPDAWQPR